MRFNGKQKPGWLALSMGRDRVDLTHVSRTQGGRPMVNLCKSYRLEGTLDDTMFRLRTDLLPDRYRLTALMPVGQYQILQVDAPAVPANELAAALRWRIKEMIDYPVEDAVVETMSIPLDQAPIGRMPQAFAIVANADAIRTHAGALTRSGLALSVIDIQENAQRNLSALFEEPGRGIAMLVFDEAGGLLTVTADGELFLARRIDIPLTALGDASDDERQCVHDRITLELQRSLDNFERQFGFVAVAKLLLAGVGAVDGLRDGLAENLYLPVEALDIAEVIDFPGIPELQSPARQAQCLAVIGAALRPAPAGTGGG